MFAGPPAALAEKAPLAQSVPLRPIQLPGRLVAATPDALHHVAAHMRAMDRREVYGLHWFDDPDSLVHRMMTMAPLAWVALAPDNGEPVYAFAILPVRPGVWAMGGFGTDRFPVIARPLTRFTRHLIVSTLADDFGHRIECVSIAEKIDGHRWLESLGAQREGVLHAYGRNQEDYIMFAWRKQPWVS